MKAEHSWLNLESLQKNLRLIKVKVSLHFSIG